MTALTWVALAGAAGVAALPSPSAGRVALLTAGGRLRAGVVVPRRRFTTAAPAVVLGVGAALVVGVGVTGGPTLAVAAAGLLATAFVLVRDSTRRRVDAHRHRDVLTAVRVLAGELEAGARPGDALAAAAATSGGARALLEPAAEAAARGGDAAALLTDSDLRALGAAWRLGEASGAALTEVVERVAAELAHRDTQRRAVAVALAGPRASALLVGGLPVIGLVLGAAMGARPLDFLLADPIGRALCCGGVLLDLAGVWWIRAIVRRVERA